MTFTVKIIRHAQTDFNKAHLVHSVAAGSINEHGQAQARKLGKFLKGSPVTKIYSSDAERTQQTANCALEEMGCSVPVVVDRRLREQEFGEWEGLKTMDWVKKVIAEKKDPREIHPPGGESHEQVKARVDEFFQDVLKHYGNGDETILIFTHGITIQVLLKFWKDHPERFELDNFSFNSMRPIENTARTQFTVQKLGDGAQAKWKLTFHTLLDAGHL